MKRSLACGVLISAGLLFGTHGKYAPLPDQIVTAKSVFLQNDSGQENLIDEMYRELEVWGRWKVVTNRKDADIVMSIDRKALDSRDRFRNNFYLHILNARNGEELLTLKRNKVMGRTGNVVKQLVSDLKDRLPSPEK
jgi:hypothetical protein